MINTDGLAKNAVVITPSDTVNFIASKGVYLGVTGDLKADMSSGATVIFKSLQAGAIHPLSVKRIYATDTTATDIVVVM